MGEDIAKSLGTQRDPGRKHARSAGLSHPETITNHKWRGYSRLHSEQAQKSRITYGGYSKPRKGKPNRDRSLDWAFRGLPLSKSNCFQQTKLVCGIGRGGGGTLRIFITGRAARASPAQLTAATFSLKSVIPGQASLPEPAPDPGN